MKSSFEESTKIHSASELEEMVRKAKSQPERSEFEDDEHTMIGNSQELATRSMSVPDAPPPSRPSSNVIRRTGPAAIVRAPTEPPVAPSTDEDEAFAPWDDAAQRTSPQDAGFLAALKEPVADLMTLMPGELAPDEVALTPDMMLDEEPPAPVVAAVAKMPALARMPSPIAITQVAGSATRWSRTLLIVSTISVVVIVGVLALGYRHIRNLEDELAATKEALDAANARLAPTRRQ